MDIRNGSPASREAAALREMAWQALRLACLSHRPDDRAALFELVKTCQAEARALERPRPPRRRGAAAPDTPRRAG